MTDKFWPTKGIRQGDPISLYLFILCIERLAQLTKTKVDIGIWKPLKTSRYGPNLTLVFFTDDLILFSKASREQMEVVNRTLDIFCRASGDMVSREKLMMCYSKSVQLRTTRLLCSFSNFTLQNDLRTYLRVPLLHKKSILLHTKELIEFRPNFQLGKPKVSHW